MLWDTHMHTYFSSDSEAGIQEMIEAAITAGIDGVCFTDHMDVDYPYEVPQGFCYVLY